MSLSNKAVPKYYGMFRDAVIRGENEQRLINAFECIDGLFHVG